MSASSKSCLYLAPHVAIHFSFAMKIREGGKIVAIPRFRASPSPPLAHPMPAKNSGGRAEFFTRGDAFNRYERSPRWLSMILATRWRDGDRLARYANVICFECHLDRGHCGYRGGDIYNIKRSPDTWRACIRYMHGATRLLFDYDFMIARK